MKIEKKRACSRILLGVALLGISCFATAAERGPNKPSVGEVELEKNYAWKMVSPMAAGQITNRGAVEFIKTIEQRTKGKVRIVFYEGTLGTPSDAWELAKNNAVQFAFTSDAYNVGRTPILAMVGLPMQFPDAKAVWLTANEWLRAGYLRELTDHFKVLPFFQPSDALTPFLRKKKVLTMDDFKGLKIRCGGGIPSEAVRLLGGTGVSLPGSEVYMALQTGVIDGAISGIDIALDRKLYETSKYALNQPFVFGIFVLLMNKDVWNGLPPRLQQVIEQTAEEINSVEVQKRLEEEKVLWSKYSKMSSEVYTISREEKAKWERTVAGVAEKYVRETAAKGHPAREAADAMRKALSNYGRAE